MVDFDYSSDRCRLCSTLSTPATAEEIFPAGCQPKRALITMIYECTSIRISFERDRRCLVCDQCLRMLKQFHGYRSRCLANDQVLRLDRTMEEDDNSDDDDPLDGDEAFTIKTEDDGEVNDEVNFYGRMKRQIRQFLDKKTKEIEQKALTMVDEAVRNRRVQGIGEKEAEGGVDWKSKYEILQKNNELLQKAFHDQREKLKLTEQILTNLQKNSILTSSVESFAEDSDHDQVGGKFTRHPAIPEISTDFLQNLNYNSGPGEKGDRNFISKLALAVFGEDILVNSSVTGRPSNAHHNIPPKPPLCSEKMAAIEAKLYERVEQEVGRNNRSELLQRSSEKVVRLVVCQKSMNLRKQVQKRSQSTAGGGSGNVSFGEDDQDEDPRPRTKRKAT